jgi:hypothetical protein
MLHILELREHQLNAITGFEENDIRKSCVVKESQFSRGGIKVH